jgi:hypothetical protein
MRKYFISSFIFTLLLASLFWSSPVFAQNVGGDSTLPLETVPFDNSLNIVVDEAPDTKPDKPSEEDKKIKGAPSIYTGGLVGKENDASRYDIKNIRDTLLPSIARWIGGFLGALAVLALIWSGVLFLTAGGEEEKISKAVKSAFYTLAALLLMMFGYVMVYLFLTIFTP